MRAVLQRVSSAAVAIGGADVARIAGGLVVLLGIESGDEESDGRWLAEKIAKLRIFPDDAGQMNRSIIETGGDALVVSQFTLHASTAKGTRPSFHAAARPELAAKLYHAFVAQLQELLGRAIQTGQFGAMMDVSIINHGPVTIILDSRRRD